MYTHGRVKYHTMADVDCTKIAAKVGDDLIFCISENKLHTCSVTDYCESLYRALTQTQGRGIEYAFFSIMDGGGSSFENNVLTWKDKQTNIKDIDFSQEAILTTLFTDCEYFDLLFRVKKNKLKVICNKAIKPYNHQPMEIKLRLRETMIEQIQRNLKK